MAKSTLTILVPKGKGAIHVFHEIEGGRTLKVARFEQNEALYRRAAASFVVVMAEATGAAIQSNSLSMDEHVRKAIRAAGFEIEVLA